MSSQTIQTRELFLIRIVLATIWVMTGILSFGIFPQQESLQLLAKVGLHGEVALFALYGSASLDVLLGILTVTLPKIWLWRIQAALVIVYSILIAIFLPSYWLHPFAPILKNLPILLLLWILHQHQRGE